VILPNNERFRRLKELTWLMERGYITGMFSLTSQVHISYSLFSKTFIVYIGKKIQWYIWLYISGTVTDGSNGDIVDDHYHRYKVSSSILSHYSLP